MECTIFTITKHGTYYLYSSINGEWNLAILLIVFWKQMRRFYVTNWIQNTIPILSYSWDIILLLYNAWNTLFWQSYAHNVLFILSHHLYDLVFLQSYEWDVVLLQYYLGPMHHMHYWIVKFTILFMRNTWSR